MTNFLHEYKLDDNNLKLGKKENWGNFPSVGKIKGNTAPLLTMQVMAPSAQFLESPLKIFPVLPKGTPEAWGKESDNLPNLAFFLLIDEDFRELIIKLSL